MLRPGSSVLNTVACDFYPCTKKDYGSMTSYLILSSGRRCCRGGRVQYYRDLCNMQQDFVKQLFSQMQVACLLQVGLHLSHCTGPLHKLLEIFFLAREGLFLLFCFDFVICLDLYKVLQPIRVYSQNAFFSLL